MIASKPSSGEEIIIEATNALGGKKLIATLALDTFFEDLEQQQNSSEQESSIAMMAGMLARIAKIEYDITPNPFTVDSTGWTVDTTLITIDMAKA